MKKMKGKLAVDTVFRFSDWGATDENLFLL
jgi:hypothetical protein